MLASHAGIPSEKDVQQAKSSNCRHSWVGLWRQLNGEGRGNRILEAIGIVSRDGDERDHEPR
jgi:hypothetical protein